MSLPKAALILLPAFPACAALSDDGGPGRPFTRCGAVTSDETWPAGPDPIVLTCLVSVEEGATLTIPAGAKIFAQNGAGIQVGVNANGRLLALGEAGAPIELELAGDRFADLEGNSGEAGPPMGGPGDSTSESSEEETLEGVDNAAAMEDFSQAASEGTWSGISLGPGASGSILENVRIQGADGLRGALGILDSEVQLRGVEITGATECGLWIGGRGRLHAESHGLRLWGNGLPVCAPAAALDNLPTSGSNYTGNQLDGVMVTSPQVWGSHVWPALGVPYYPKGDLEIGGMSTGSLELPAGAELRLRAGSTVRVGGASPGTFAALGTEGEPTVISGIAGAWRQIRMSGNGSQLTLHHTSISLGGAGEVPALRLDEGTFAYDHLVVMDMEGDGVHLAPELKLEDNLLALQVQTTGRAIRLSPPQVALVIDGGLTLADNRLPGIELLACGEECPISADQRWSPLGEPYIARGSIRIEDGGNLQLQAGVLLQFAAGAGLLVGDAGAGRLLVEGTEEDPVIFEPLGGDPDGRWSGLALRSGATGSQLSGFEVLGAGGAGVRGAIEINRNSGVLLRDGVVARTATDECPIQLIATTPAIERVDVSENAKPLICKD
jgi:hypothetical protein